MGAFFIADPPEIDDITRSGDMKWIRRVTLRMSVSRMLDATLRGKRSK